METRAKPFGGDFDDACVGDTRRADSDEVESINGQREAEWMSHDHTPPSQQRQRQLQLPVGSVSGGPDDDRVLNARRAEGDNDAVNCGQLEAGWMSHDHTPPSQKQAGGDEWRPPPAGAEAGAATSTLQ